MHPALRLVRLGNTVVSFAGTVVGGLAARGTGLGWDGPFFLILGLAAVSTACVTAGGNVLNDVLDRSSDAVNHPDRPLVTGAISVAAAKRLVVGLLAVSAIAILPFALAHPFVPLILVLAVASVLSYEFRFKAHGLSGNALVAFLTAAVFLYGGATTDRIVFVVPFALMAFGATLSREVIKDMEDAKGDVGRSTLPRVHGMRLAAVAARLAVAAAIVLSPIPLFEGVVLASAAGIMYAVSVLAADGLFVVSVLWLPARLHREQTLSKGAMTVALVAFLASAFR